MSYLPNLTSAQSSTLSTSLQTERIGSQQNVKVSASQQCESKAHGKRSASPITPQLHVSKKVRLETRNKRISSADTATGDKVPTPSKSLTQPKVQHNPSSANTPGCWIMDDDTISIKFVAVGSLTVNPKPEIDEEQTISEASASIKDSGDGVIKASISVDQSGKEGTVKEATLEVVCDTTNKASVSIEESGVKDTEKQTPVGVNDKAANEAVSIGEDIEKEAEMEDIAKTTTEAAADMIGHEEASKDSMHVITGEETAQRHASIEQSGAKDTEKRTPADVISKGTTEASAMIGKNNIERETEMELTAETSSETTALTGHVDTGKDSMEVIAGGKTSVLTNKPPKVIIAARNTTGDSASTEKEVTNMQAPMEGMEEEEESEDEWAVFDELDQTIDEVTNNAKQRTKPTLEKDINNTSSPPLQSVSEKTDEKTLPHTSQTSQEKSLMPPPPTSTLAGESSLTGDTADEFDKLDQTIDHVIIASNQLPKTTMEKVIENTSNPIGKSISEKTVEKTLPDASQTSQEKSLPTPPATAASERISSEGTADECDSTADTVVNECSDTVGVGDLTEGTPVASNGTATKALQNWQQDSDDSDDVMVLHESGPSASRLERLQQLATLKTESAQPVRVNKNIQPDQV